MSGQQNRMFRPLHAPPVAAPDGGLVQILNLDNNHWLCASTVGCDLGVVNMYNSLYTGVTGPRLFNLLAAYIILRNQRW